MSGTGETSGNTHNGNKKNMPNRRRQKQLKRMDAEYEEARETAERAEILLTEENGFIEGEGMEKTWRFRQEEIVENVDISTANKRFDLKLNDYGPYTIDYTRNGRDLLIGGKKGHIASFDWRLGKLNTELHLGETVNAVKYLQNNQMFAVAQKNMFISMTMKVQKFINFRNMSTQHYSSFYHTIIY